VRSLGQMQAQHGGELGPAAARAAPARMSTPEATPRCTSFRAGRSAETSAGTRPPRPPGEGQETFHLSGNMMQEGNEAAGHSQPMRAGAEPQ